MKARHTLKPLKLIALGLLFACVTLLALPQTSQARSYYRNSRVITSTILPNGVVIANGSNHYGWRNQRSRQRCGVRRYQRPVYRINRQIVPGIRTGINLNRNPSLQISRRGFGSYSSPRFSSWRSAF